MEMLGYMCVQSFIVMHPTIIYLKARIVQTVICDFVYKFLITKFSV